MPNTPSKLSRANIVNPSDNVLNFITAGCMSILGFKYASATTTYFKYIPLPNDLLSVASAVFLILYLFLISFKAIQNLTIILKINSSKYRRDLLAAVSIADNETIALETFLDRISPYTAHLRIEYIKDPSGEIKSVDFSPIEASSFTASMKRFKVTVHVNGGLITGYEKEGFS